ncbi:MAG: peptide deformylase [Nitrospinaceae bacterium]|jgi:peptide deformylase|nr:peptide deformylase [Nitrospinaceae bacterium]MDP7148693.1 peptide deformylase [Nitrospinaceae bacterium]|tara:strand:- start:803 stop:1303 length:501 start_codon:yes stop_codon:yes gene_type:complete
MAVFDILVYPDPRLKEVSRQVNVIDESVMKLVSDLEDTIAAGPPSVGIAAPQIGRFERIAIVDVSSKSNIPNHGKLILINPQIISKQGAVKGREGCLSVPDYTGNVIRPERITLQALDLMGKNQSYDMEGFEARAVLHEIDHLDGLLFLDRLVSRRDNLFRRKVYK